MSKEHKHAEGLSVQWDSQHSCLHFILLNTQECCHVSDQCVYSVVQRKASVSEEWGNKLCPRFQFCLVTQYFTFKKQTKHLFVAVFCLFVWFFQPNQVWDTWFKGTVKALRTAQEPAEIMLGCWWEKSLIKLAWGTDDGDKNQQLNDKRSLVMKVKLSIDQAAEKFICAVKLDTSVCGDGLTAGASAGC